MSKITLEDCTELGMSRLGSLEVHLTANFYPPLPDYVKESIIKTFKKHWAGKLDDMSKMVKGCYLRDTNALYKYFGEYIVQDDFPE